MQKVSILVAVYNSEHYLRQCLESLIAQTYSDIQIICVDDASTDDSWNLLQEYSVKDSRIIIARNKINQGQARTRNKGLEYADGEFVTMVDSDDWLAKDAIEEAMKIFRDSPITDCVLFDLINYYEKDNRFISYPDYTGKVSFSGEEALKESLDWSLHGLYITRTNIQRMYPYDECVRFGGDDNTSRLHYMCSREVRRSSGKYYYRIHEKSVTGEVSINQFDTLTASLDMKEHLEKLSVSRSLRCTFERICWHEVVNMYDYYLKYKKRFTEKERAEILDKIRNSWSKVNHSALPLKEKIKGGYITLYSFAAFNIWVSFYRWVRINTPAILLKKRLKY